jgi:RNA 2',3'-cyclic 3'-phosphodiesterase
MRLFVAIEPPETVRADLAALQAPLDGVAWTHPEQLHLTLRFIGETEHREKIEAALERVRVEPFILPVEGIGVFPAKGPAKILWAGVGRAHPRLFQLRQQVDDALLSADLGIAMPNFHPHFTLGRVTRPPEERDKQWLAAFDRWRKSREAFEGPPFKVAEFHLHASEPRAGGAVHTRLRSYALSE